MASTMTAMILMTCSLTAQAAHLKGFQVWNLKAHAAELRLTTNLTAVSASYSYGSKDCPCIGVDNIEGKTMALVKKGEPKESYPADLGARCEAWDLKDHPKCPGESWCAQQWCYVDPCNCNIPVLPKPASYLPDAQYQGKPLFFSYATCGGTDSYTGKENEKDGKTALLIKETCAAEVSETKWGEEDCRCVGVGPQPGTTKVNIGGKMVDFPASTGSTCTAWEKDNHPDCQGKDAPDWCSKAWCYVDPCKCKLATPPKTSSYLPDGNYQGKPVYYSYATCGAEDSFSAGDKKACVNQKTSSDCAKMDKCAWSGKECLGKELVTVCNKADRDHEATEAARARRAEGLKGWPRGPDEHKN